MEWSRRLRADGSLGPLRCLLAAGGGVEITQMMGLSPIPGVKGSQLWGLTWAHGSELE